MSERKEIRKGRIRKALMGLLAVVAAGALSGAAGVAAPVKAYAAVKEVNLDSRVLRPADGKWDKTNDHKLYFGQYNGSPTAFRVLPQSPSTMSERDRLLLDCDTILEKMIWNAQGDGNSWNSCAIRTWLNGSDYFENSSVFTSLERDAIARTDLYDVT